MSDRGLEIQPPVGSQIRVVSADLNRLVMVLPPGGKNVRGIGCFAVIWLCITAIVSAFFAASMLGSMTWEGDAPSLWFLIPFLSVFWAVGLGLAFAWLKMSFTQTLLSVERTRFAAQFELFGRKQIKMLELDDSSRAELVEAYSENDRPVYRIAVVGIGGEEKFGTSLSQTDKEWLVVTLNQFLGHSTPSQTLGVNSETVAFSLTACPQCGAELRSVSGGSTCDHCGDFNAESAAAPSSMNRSFPGVNSRSVSLTERCPELSPSELPADSRLTVDDSDPNKVSISYRAVHQSAIKLVGILFLSFFCAIWFGITGTVIVMGKMEVLKDGVVGPQVAVLIVPLIWMGFGCVPLATLWFLAAGRVVVWVDHDGVRARLQAGPFYKEKRIAMESIVDVGIGTTSSSPAVPIRGGPKKLPWLSGGSTCVLLSKTLSLPLSMSVDREFNCQLAGLVAHYLRQFGHPLPHE